VAVEQAEFDDPTPKSTITSRDLDLIEVALDSAIAACQGGAVLRGRKIDPLAREYLTAKDHLRHQRKLWGI
jgi:hypothetical protein